MRVMMFTVVARHFIARLIQYRQPLLFLFPARRHIFVDRESSSPSG